MSAHASEPLTSPVTECITYPDTYDTDVDWDETPFGWQRVRIARCDLCREVLLDTEDERGDHSDIAHCGVCGQKVCDHLSTEDPCRIYTPAERAIAEDDYRQERAS